MAVAPVVALRTMDRQPPWLPCRRSSSRILARNLPTSALDPETVGEVLLVMQELAQDGITSIIVTHELGFARRTANRVRFMDAGRIVHAASAEDFFGEAAPERVGHFLRSMTR